MAEPPVEASQANSASGSATFSLENILSNHDDLEHPKKKAVVRVRPKGPRDDKSPAARPAADPNARRKAAAKVPKGPGSLTEAGTSDCDDSEGPITPVHAVTKPSQEAPVLCEEQDLGDAALLRDALAAKVISPCPLRVVNDSEAGLVVAA